MEETGKRREIRSFVIRGGRLSPLQQRAIDGLYDTYAIPYSGKETDIASCFAQEGQTIIEIGFGMGVSTARIAREFPQNNYLGIEVHRPGIGKLLSEIERYGLENLRIIEHDAVEVLKYMVPDSSIDGFHIFFPDPWPKKKHHKRRLLNTAFVHLLATKLKEGGYIYAVTDWVEYAEQMLEVLVGEELLKNSADTYAEHIPWRPQTKFEAKGIDKSHEIRELWFERR